MRKIVFATHNEHKLSEVRQMLSGVVEVIGLNDLELTEEIEENEPTLEGNARVKMRYVTEKFSLDCFADDTGLEVEALGGAPGVHSARYAGEPVDSERNIDKLLNNLEAETNRNARFRTAIALSFRGKEYLFEGIVDGEILHERRGSEGFGYDSVFQPKGYSQSFAEMSGEQKNKISHRGQAISRVVEFLKKENL